MSVVKSAKKTAVADWHRADVIARLHKKGWSLRALSLANGFSGNTLKGALDAPYPKAERIIAMAIGEQPETIWPERYAKRNFTRILSRAGSSGGNKSVKSVPETELTVS